MFPTRLTVLLLVVCGVAVPGAQGDGSAVAPAVYPETLPAAQTRLRYAQEDLESAWSQVKRQEQRLKDAEASLARQQKKVEEEQGKVEQTKNALTDARARADQPKQKYDDAYANSQRLYRERQQPPARANAPEASKP